MAGRKKIDDKKVRLDIYVRQSVIDANGGKEQAKENAAKHLKGHISVKLNEKE